MDFTFTEDQELTRRMVREFAENEIAPKVRYYDETQEFPFDIMQKLGDLGLLGVVFPPEYGGSGMSYLDYVCVIEEIGRVIPRLDSEWQLTMVFVATIFLRLQMMSRKSVF